MDHINTNGEYTNNREITETVVKDSYARYQDLVSYGVEFLRDENGEPRFKEYFEPWGMNLRSYLWAPRKTTTDVSLYKIPVIISQKEGTNNKKGIYTRTDYQQTPRRRIVEQQRATVAIISKSNRS